MGVCDEGMPCAGGGERGRHVTGRGGREDGASRGQGSDKRHRVALPQKGSTSGPRPVSSWSPPGRLLCRAQAILRPTRPLTTPPQSPILPPSLSLPLPHHPPSSFPPHTPHSPSGDDDRGSASRRLTSSHIRHPIPPPLSACLSVPTSGTITPTVQT